MQTLSIVVPVFNTVKSLDELVLRVEETLKNVECIKDYEFILVNDGSSNSTTWKQMKRLSSKKPNVISISLMRNFGQQAATMCGIREAKGDYILTMDDDLQHPPEEISKLLEMRDHDVVIGQFSNKKHSFQKRLFSRIKGYFDRIILGKPKGIQLSPFRLINRKTIDGILMLDSTPYPFLPAMMLYVTKDLVGVEVNHSPRKEGQTGYTFNKMIKMFSNLMISNSSFLLRLIGKIGIAIAVISLTYGAYLIYRRIFDTIDLIGWTSVMVAVLFIGGIILFSMGVIGEYLIRITEGIDKKPTYIIREKLAGKK